MDRHDYLPEEESKQIEQPVSEEHHKEYDATSVKQITV